MANMHLVTGYAGQEHVTAADHGSFFAALVGGGSYVMDKGNKFAISKISNNLIRVLDGDLLMQGRHIRIPDASYVELAVENGTQGYKRSDLVVIRYTKDADTGVEETNLVILRGDPVAASPADPAYITGNILDGDLQHDLPLYRLNLNGLEIESIDTLFAADLPTHEDNSVSVKTLQTDIAGILAQLASAGGVKFASGSYTGTGTSGESTPTQIVLNFTRPIILYLRYASDSTITEASQLLAFVTDTYTSTATALMTAPSMKYADGTLSMYASKVANQYNSKIEYKWVALGV